MVTPELYPRYARSTRLLRVSPISHMKTYAYI